MLPHSLSLQQHYGRINVNFLRYLSATRVLKTAAKMLHSAVKESPPPLIHPPKSKYFILCLLLLLVTNGIEAYWYL